jgi:hypothetical protein
MGILIFLTSQHWKNITSGHKNCEILNLPTNVPYVTTIRFSSSILYYILWNDVIIKTLHCESIAEYNDYDTTAAGDYDYSDF